MQTTNTSQLSKNISGKISLDQLTTLINNDEIDTISIIFVDMFGRIICEKLDPEFFLERMNKGFTQVNALNVIDYGGQIVQSSESNIEGGYSNSVLFPILDTLRISYMPKEVVVFCQYKPIFSEADYLTDPREILKTQIEKAAKMGFELKCAGEYEFIIFKTLNKETQYPCTQNIIKNSLWHESAYESLQLSDEFEPLMKKIRQRLKQVGIVVEGQQIELCPNQHELKIKYCSIMEQADRLILYKQTIKQVCKENGFTATFMAKPVDNVSSGCHIHFSMYDAKTKQNCFSGKDYALNKDGLSCSKIMLNFIGGLIKYTRESFLFYAPFINSYKRYIAEDFAPRNISAWAYDNRTSSIRVVGGGLEGEDLRIEFRFPGADCNPYLAIASVLVSGLSGITEQIQPPEKISGNVFAKTEVEECYQVPFSLKQAIDVFKNSKYIEQWFGKSAQEHFVLMHQQEVLKYNSIVTDWEVKRYLDKV